MTETRTAICTLNDLPVGQARVFVVDGDQVAVFKMRSGVLHAVQAVCPHKGGPLADGQADERVIVCPLHQYAYDLSTGACTNGEQPSLRTFPITADATGQVFIG